VVREAGNLILESFNFLTKDLLFLAENFDSNVARTLHAHFLRLGGQSRKVDLTILHAALLL